MNSIALRTIISMSGTVTNEIAQYLYQMIRPYIGRTFMIKSADELLVALETVLLQSGQKLLSLDVESLFTKVPVDNTIDIII